MRVTVFGGTVFIGRAIVEELAAAGHDVTVVHRGEHETEEQARVTHLHLAREEWAANPRPIAATEPDTIVDCLAMSRDDVERALAVVPKSAHLVVLSSHDVYRAFASLNAARDTDALPVDESSPLRDDRYPYRGRVSGRELYSKLDVEERYRSGNALVLRLPATYGEHDNQRREEFILRRVRAGRTEVPIGGGGFLWTRGWVRDIARGARQAAEAPQLKGEVLNLGEQRTWSVRLWAQRILEAAGSDCRLVDVPDDALPDDLAITSSRLSQHVLVSTARARALLGYTDSDPVAALSASVGWHLAHPPEPGHGDFSADDAALRRALPAREPG